MASFWQTDGFSIFFSDREEDYEQPVPDQVAEDEGYVVCLSPMSEDSDSETFIDDEYDICDDVIEEIEDIKRQEELLEAGEAPEEEPDTYKLVAEEGDIKEVVQAGIKRRRPQVSSESPDLTSSCQSALGLAREADTSSTKRQKLLGKGTFGKVYKVEEDGEVFAVKEMEVSDPNSAREQDMLETVKHRHIIRYVRAYRDGPKLNIVMEFADRGTLTKIVREADLSPDQHPGTFQERNIWRFLKQMSSALCYLHNHRPRRILHRDLKVPSTIILTKVLLTFCPAARQHPGRDDGPPQRQLQAGGLWPGQAADGGRTGGTLRQHPLWHS